MDSFELAERLATRPTKSTAYMTYQVRLESICEFLGDLNRFAKEGRIAAAWALEWIEENSDVSHLRRWKEEALPILVKYDEIAEMVGGELGSSNMDNLEKFVRSKIV